MVSETQTCSWEEDIYWNHFQYTHFSRFLHSDFNTRLAIPRKFSNKMRTRLPTTVTLRGPSGNSWIVGVARTNDNDNDDDTLFFSCGWKEFARDHSLHASDLLIFKYNGDSLFDVLVLDLESSCEKASSYFARKQEPWMKTGGDTDTAAEYLAPSPVQQDVNGDAGDGIPEKSVDDIGVNTEQPTELSNKQRATNRDCSEKSKRRALKLASYFSARKQGTGKKIGATTASTTSAGSGGFPDSPPTTQHNYGVDGSARKGNPDKSAEGGLDAKLPRLPTCPPVISLLSNKRARAELTKPATNRDCGGRKSAAEEPNQRQGVLKSVFSRIQEIGKEVEGSTATASASSGGPSPNVGQGSPPPPPPPPEKSAEDGIDKKPPPLPTCPPIIFELSNKRARVELTKPVVVNRYCSGWKPVAEESKVRALKLAKAALSLTKEGFISVMKTTNVRKCFYMTIPMAWIKKYMDGQMKQDVILRVGEREWRVGYKLRKKKDSGGLTNGWKIFAEDNNLQPFDVCLFKIGKTRGHVPGVGCDMVLDVDIFRC